MHFVDEDDGAGAILPRALGIGHDLLDFLDPGEHRGELDEVRVGHARDNLRQSGLADSGWSPEDERASIVTLNLHAQRLARTQDVLLAGKLVERPRTHAVGQRTGPVDGFIVRRIVLKKAQGRFTTENTERTEEDIVSRNIGSGEQFS